MFLISLFSNHFQRIQQTQTHLMSVFSNSKYASSCSTLTLTLNLSSSSDDDEIFSNKIQIPIVVVLFFDTHPLFHHAFLINRICFTTLLPFNFLYFSLLSSTEKITYVLKSLFKNMTINNYPSIYSFTQIQYYT